MNTVIRLFLIIAISLLTACAGQEKQTEKPTGLSGTEVLQSLQQHLPGHYSNFAQQWLDNKQPLRLLDVTLLKANNSEVWMLTRQQEFSRQDSSQSSMRQQILLFRTTEDDEIKFRFAPHKGEPSAALVSIASGRVAFLPGCEITLFPGKDGLLGQTSASECKLPGANNPAGLSKSIKIQAGIITIADQLSRDGTSSGAANIQQFYRSQLFTGWAGFKTAHSDWQQVAPFEIYTDGEELSLIDPDGNNTGIHIRLSQVPWKKGERMILRLDLIDPATGKPTTYAFTDPDAENIGLNLGDVQLGLKRK